MEKQIVRNSNIELLRLIAMFLIVAGHYLSYSGLIENVTGVNQLFAYIIGSGARIAVTLFLMIGIWFMIGRDFKAKRLVMIYSEIWFYGVIITALLLIMGHPVDKYSILRIIFPFFFRSIWFGTAYISLLLASPFLNRILEWEKEVIRKYLIILSIIIIPITAISGFNDTWLDVILWFFYMYLFVGYYKIHLQNKIKVNKYAVLTVGVILYLIIVLGKMVCFNLQAENALFYYGYKVFSLWIIDYKQIPNLFCACCIFFFVINLRPKYNKIINWFADGIFAVYIIHQIPPMESYLWVEILKCQTWWEKPDEFMAMSLIVISSVMIIGLFMDRVRVRWLESWWIKTKLFNKISNRIDKLYNINK